MSLSLAPANHRFVLHSYNFGFLRMLSKQNPGVSNNDCAHQKIKYEHIVIFATIFAIIFAIIIFATFESGLFA